MSIIKPKKRPMFTSFATNVSYDKGGLITTKHSFSTYVLYREWYPSRFRKVPDAVTKWGGALRPKPIWTWYQRCNRTLSLH
jgi:hypothetical protein